MNKIDVLQLIDRLEQLVTTGMRFPLTSRAVIDEQQFLELIDQLRVAVPEEIKQAKRVSQEIDRVLFQAQAEADKIIATAREQAGMLLQEEEIVKMAQARANDIIAEAERNVEEIRQGADEYALEILTNLDQEMTRGIASVRKGKAALERLIEFYHSNENPSSLSEKADAAVE